MGAWIEIAPAVISLSSFSSLPSWERGLKSVVTDDEEDESQVAPFVGAWIEILVMMLLQLRSVSLPSWERGLKYKIAGGNSTFLPSLPSWERGLKFWICNTFQIFVPSLPSWERGLKLSIIIRYVYLDCRSLRGSVD